MIDLEVVDASSSYFIHGQRKLLSTSNSKFGSHEIEITEPIKPNIEFLPAPSPPLPKKSYAFEPYIPMPKYIYFWRLCPFSSGAIP